MDVKGFSDDSVTTIEGVGRQWVHSRQHDPPSVRRRVNRDRQHERPVPARAHTPPRPEENNQPRKETGDGPEGFEITI
ncbi:MAG: hypothetical protein ABSC19_13330 [Syntrophorhabdales bacterium]|jgi:hypothetical protein